MTNGWILDTGAVYDRAARMAIVKVLPVVRQRGHRIVLPDHVFMELLRQETSYRQRAARDCGGDPGLVTASNVAADLRAQLTGVEAVGFSQEDGLALLEHVDGLGPLGWERVKLVRAVEDAWPAVGEAILDLHCGHCQRQLRSCACTPPLWRKEDKGKLKSRAVGKCTTLAGKKRASATIDWLTVAMARRHALCAVTRDAGPEWHGLACVSPAGLDAAVRGAP